MKDLRIYKRMTIEEKKLDINSSTPLKDIDVESVWDAMADDQQKVKLSERYPSPFFIRSKDGADTRLLHIAEDIKFKHIYEIECNKPIEQTVQWARPEPAALDVEDIPEPQTVQ